MNGPLKAEQAFRGAEIVLIGTVLQVEEGESASVRVDELYKGTVPAAVEVDSGYGLDCRMWLMAGKQYLLFFSRQEEGAQKLVADNVCFPSGEVGSGHRAETEKWVRRQQKRSPVEVQPKTLGAVPQRSNLSWWLRVEFSAHDAAIESIPVQQLDPSWVAASRLRERDLPSEARAPGESLGDHGGSFEVVADLDGDGRVEKSLVGVYRNKKGEVGRFVLVLSEGGGSGWRKRALFTTPGSAGFSALFLRSGRLAWASCMECDSACAIVTSHEVWTLKCNACRDCA